MLRPKIIDTLKDYTKKQFAKDTIAGIVVGIVALPLAIAFAIASGVTPEKGLITAVVAGFIVSALGGSRVQIGGPTGAFIIIVYRIVHQYGINGLLVATIMAGIILIIFGAAKLGSVIKFIPHSVIMGFTFGIAFLIFTGQMNDFLGLSINSLPADFIDKMSIVLSNIGNINIFSYFITLGTIFLILACLRINRSIPGSLVALLASSLIVYYFKLPVETIGAKFGAIPDSLPAPSIPHVNFKIIRSLINPAFTIAILGAIESLLSAVVADGMIGGKHRSNMELIAQGVANIASPIFGGIPATGAIARTATNIKSGGRTPVAGIVHAVTLLLIMVFLGKYAGYIPMACLAGILMVVAYHMSEWRSVTALIKTSVSSALITITTFAITVLVDLTAAIEIGLILSMFVFIRNMSIHTNVSVVLPKNTDDEKELDFDDTQELIKSLPKGAVMYEIDGPLFFGAVYKFREALAGISKPPKVLILEMHQVPVIDSTGIQILNESYKSLKKAGTEFILCAIKPQIEEKLTKAGFIDKIGNENICRTIELAIKRAVVIVNNKGR